MTRRIAAHIRDGKLAIFPGGTHYEPADHPATFNKTRPRLLQHRRPPVRAMITSLFRYVINPVFMNLFRNGITLVCASLFASSIANAQAYALKESAVELKGPQHEILFCPDGDFISVTYPFTDDKDPVTISRFDHTLNQKYSSTLADLSRQHYRASIYLKESLALFCSTKEGAVSRYDINDKTGAIIGSPDELFDLQIKEEDAKFLSGDAPSKNFHYFLAQGHQKKEKGMIFQGALLNQQFAKMGVFTFITPEDRDDFNHVDYIQGDNGMLFLIYSVKVKTSKEDYTPYAYNVVIVDPTGKTSSFPVAGLPPGNLGNLTWTARGSRLVFTGFLSHGKKTGYTTIVSGSLDPFKKVIGDLKQTELATLMINAPDYLRDIREKGIPVGVTVLKALTLSDGSKAIVLEDNSDRFYQSYYAPTASPVPAANMTSNGAMLAAGTMPSYSITYHNRGYLYVLKTDRVITPQWLDIISKKQEEPDMVISIGTACTADSKDNVHLFFSDNKKNTDPITKSPAQINGLDYKKNVLACVSITPEGSMSKHFVDQQEPEFRLMLEEEAVETNNEVCVMAIKTKKAFTPEHLFNHAFFRMTTIDIK
jgi:hypothetical protein